MFKLAYVLAALMIIGGCQAESGPPLTASEVALFLPLTGSKASVAYFILENNSASTIDLESISSPQFGDVQLHETTITEGIARMQSLDRIQIPAGQQVHFETGGKHVMLTQPTEEYEPGASIELNIRYNEGGLVTINTRALSRATSE